MLNQPINHFRAAWFGLDPGIDQFSNNPEPAAMNGHSNQASPAFVMGRR